MKLTRSQKKLAVEAIRQVIRSWNAELRYNLAVEAKPLSPLQRYLAIRRGGYIFSGGPTLRTYGGPKEIRGRITNLYRTIARIRTGTCTPSDEQTIDFALYRAIQEFAWRVIPSGIRRAKVNYRAVEEKIDRMRSLSGSLQHTWRHL